MKNIVSFALSILLLLGFVIPSQSLAQEQGLEKLIIKSKEILDIGEEYSKFEYSISKDEGRTMYIFNWKNDDRSR